MSATITHSVAELEELLAAEIPCGGNLEVTCRRECDRPAALLGHPHGCRGIPEQRPHDFKCVSCWRLWATGAEAVIAQFGGIRCIRCNQFFTSVAAFSDYRPF